MRTIKTYLRPEKVEGVVRALHDAGVPHMTVLHVRSFGSGVNPESVAVKIRTGAEGSDALT